MLRVCDVGGGGGGGGGRCTSRFRTWGGWTLWRREWLPLATEGCAAPWGSRTSTQSRLVDCSSKKTLLLFSLMLSSVAGGGGISSVSESLFFGTH